MTIVPWLKGKMTRNSQEGMSSSSCDFPSHLKKPRVASRKRRASTLPGDDGDKHLGKCLA
jgi:hypothetical protein